MLSFKGMRNAPDIIITAVWSYISYKLSYRDVEEMMAERGIRVDHTSVFRWVTKCVPQLEKRFREHKKPVGRLADGRDVHSNQGQGEVSLSRGRQGRQHRGISSHRQARRQGGKEIRKAV